MEGTKKGEITVFAAESGVGKSALDYDHAFAKEQQKDHARLHWVQYFESLADQIRTGEKSVIEHDLRLGHYSFMEDGYVQSKHDGVSKISLTIIDHDTWKETLARRVVGECDEGLK